MTQIILINGPAQSGKDTTGALVEAFTGAFRTKFAKALKNRAHAMLGLDVPHDAFEMCKDVQMAEFGSMSPRQFYIWFSEEMVKPIFGDRYFGEITLKEVKEQTDAGRQVVVTDSGFAGEAQPLIEEYGRDDVELWKIYRSGKDFQGDSRSYLTLPVRTYVIDNNGTVAELAATVEARLREVRL